ncbi:MAG TPA: lantibiotic dehydratase [Thermoanaerobaculia bacterium]|jgi:thiopeptide-type bacteriocin biosynthesis protein|nr:lantibiotic dehydratase [Thermoanaerobaculia bacterium]
MAKPSPERPFAPAGFFAFRTPLLPFEELESFSAGLEAPGAVGNPDPQALAAALAADRERLRARLAALAARPEVLEAVFLASPSLYDSLAAWRAAPDSKKGLRAERALLRYVYRMAARATPFGLFSGCSLGPVETAPGSSTRIAVAPRAAYERHTRLDMDYLFALCEDLGRDPAVREALVYRPNSSLYRAAGRLRYAEARLENKIRSHHLVAVDASDYLEEALRRAEGGARARDIADALVAFDPDGEVSPEEASEFVTELIDSQILVSDLSTPVTGPEAIHDLIAQLTALATDAEIAQGARERLVQVRDELAALDAAGPGQEPARYEKIAETLRELPTPVEMSRLFQLDMVKPADQAVLGAEVLEEIGRALDVLYRLAADRPQEGLDRFRKDFNERYEGREVPLLEALDEEVGVGFERSSDFGAEASPLLRGIAFAGLPTEQNVPWGRVMAVLLAKVHEALAEGRREIEITPEDLEKMAPTASTTPAEGAPAKSPLPDTFHVMATLAAASPEALARGEFRLLFDNAGGPSGARLLGRFCHADPELSRRVEEHLRAEEAHAPNAIFAEIVHLPQGRIGNILARPVLREYELPFLGRSGAPEERQIPVSDLRVSVAGNRIVLRSARLGREVIPRLTSAHNFWRGSLGVYRFLCMLQGQGILGGVSWSWGALDGAPFLPRVSMGRLVLTRASWWMTQDEIKALAKPQGAERYTAVQQWRQKRNLPRLVALVDADNELLVDLDNALSIDTFLDVIEERDRARLVEFFPGPDELPATGPEGRFLHEILVAYARRPRQAAAEPRPRPERREQAAMPPLRRTFPPGSEWLYVKVYTGTSTADGLLREVVAPVVREALAEGVADSWFFIRYGDPEWHLRLRFHGRPVELGGRLLPRLHAELDPRLADGRLWKVQLDTYEREVERYGGPEGMLLAESIFEADSDAVLAIVDMLEGDEGADVRWRIALRGADMLLTDLGLEGEERTRTMRAMKEGFGREFGGGKGLRVQLDQKFRKEGRSLAPLLDPAGDEASELAPALAVLRRRSERLAPLCAELRERAAAGRLNQPLANLAPSFIHMHVNRMIRSAARAHELVLYDFLFQLHESRAARARKANRPAQTVPT